MKRMGKACFMTRMWASVSPKQLQNNGDGQQSCICNMDSARDPFRVPSFRFQKDSPAWNRRSCLSDCRNEIPISETKV